MGLQKVYGKFIFNTPFHEPFEAPLIAYLQLQRGVEWILVHECRPQSSEQEVPGRGLFPAQCGGKPRH